MRVDWYGQSAFRLQGDEATVFIDPFADMNAFPGRVRRWDYPAIEGVTADLLLITHEHPDHNEAGVIGGEPVVIRSAPGTHGSPVGEVIGVASEHDEAAGTQRGPNTIYVFALDGLRVAHFGDFGQRELREEQAAAIGRVDLALLPVGGGPTIDGAQAAQIARRIGARWAVPHHYRSERIDFLEPVDAFLDAVGAVHRIGESGFETGELPSGDGPVAVVVAAP